MIEKLNKKRKTDRPTKNCWPVCHYPLGKIRI